MAETYSGKSVNNIPFDENGNVDVSSGPIDESNLVHIDGSEEITGAKRFLDDVIISNGSEASLKLTGTDLVFRKDDNSSSVTISTQDLSNHRIQSLSDKDGILVLDVDLVGQYLDEGNGVGIIFTKQGREFYGNLGLDAVDFSYSDIESTIYGATGVNSFNVGIYNSANGFLSTNFGFLNNTSASGGFTTGYNNLNAGYTNLVSGIGHDVTSMVTTVLGQASNVISEEAALDFNAWPNKPLLVVGNGNIENGNGFYPVLSRSDAFIVRYNGIIEAPSVTNTEIDSSGDKTLTTKEWVLANISSGSSVDTQFFVKTYSSSMSIEHNKNEPNFSVTLVGPLNLVITDTENGDSGMVNIYTTEGEVIEISGLKGLSLIGNGEMIPVYFIHDSGGLRWYDGRESTGGSQDFQSILDNGAEWTKTEDGVVKIIDFSAGGLFGSNSDILFQANRGTNSTRFMMTGGNTSLMNTDSSTGISDSVSHQGFNKFVAGGFNTSTVLDTPVANTTLHFPAPTVAGDYILVTDAPSNGTDYVRKDGTWVEATSGAKQDGTTLWHQAVATSTGTVTSVGVNWTGTGTEISSNYVGAKLTIEGVGVAIIATVDESAQTFTTLEPFATEFTDAEFEIRAIAHKINPDGTLQWFDHEEGVPRFELRADKSVRIHDTYFGSNSTIVSNPFYSRFGHHGLYSGYHSVTESYIVDNLPTLNSSEVAYASVTDALNPVIGQEAEGGGTNKIPVYWDGSIWLCLLGTSVSTSIVGEPTGSSIVNNIVQISQENYDEAVIANTLVDTTLYIIRN